MIGNYDGGKAKQGHPTHGDEDDEYGRMCSLADKLEESGDKENAEFLRSIAEDRSMTDPESGDNSDKDGLSDKQMRLLQEKLRQKVSKVK